MRDTTPNHRRVDFPQNGYCNGNEKPNGTVKFDRQHLPIDDVRLQLRDHFRRHETCVLVGETGSGKSTQVPQICLEADFAEDGLIGVTQPRRVAAQTLANRVAQEMDCEVGQEVGYSVRFENKTSERTKIAYMTDGILLREALRDAFLSRYSVIVVDEAHERSVHTDVLLYVLRLAQRQRKEQRSSRALHLIIMSATIQCDKFSAYFAAAPVYYIEGRTHSVETYFVESTSKDEDNYVYMSIRTVMKLHESEPINHDFLVFLTGQEEIELACRMVKKEMNNQNSVTQIAAIPLHASQSASLQARAFLPAPSRTRKVIFATNIAETSVTIPGIRVVIDSGKVKQRSYNAQTRIDVLRVQSISKAQAIQRAGRAGRDAPGKCFRLYSQKDYENLEDMPVPEILRSNLSSILLELVSLGLKRPHNIGFIDPPDDVIVEAAVDELIRLEAIKITDAKKLKMALTGLGTQLVMFPIDPCLARILVTAAHLDCLEEALTVVSFLSGETVFTQTEPSSENGQTGDNLHRKFDTREGDHCRMVSIWRLSSSLKKDKQRFSEFCKSNGLHKGRLETIGLIRKQLRQLCHDQGLIIRSCAQDMSRLRRAICHGLHLNACQYDRSTDDYRLVSRPSVHVKIHPSSCLARSRPTTIVFSDLVKTTDLFARDVSLIDADWLKESQLMPGGLQPAQASQPQQNLLEISWKDPGVPPNCLTVENIMHYFCQKENFFYDMTCDNQTIRMQHQNMNFPPPDAFDDILRQMNGIQYVLCEASPPLFVICKHKRHSRDHVTPMCYYYVLNSVVYQAPDIYALVQSRLVSVVDPLRDALGKTLDSLRFNVSKGYWWEFKSPAAKHSTTLKDKEKKSDMADADESNPFNVRATPFQRTRTDKLLQLLVERFPVDNMEIQYGETQASRLQASTNPSDADAAAVPDGLRVWGQPGGSCTSVHSTIIAVIRCAD
ncbi:DEAH protein [Aphelenchoides avenae]|nr:DEAH protein [Aphelenchus avenae]